MAGYGLALYGLGSYGDPQVIPFISGGTGTAGPEQQITGKATSGVNISGTALPVMNVGGGTI